MKIRQLINNRLDFDLNYGRIHILDWCNSYFHNYPTDTIQILDIGCGSGNDLKNLARTTSHQIKLFGIEIRDQNIEDCKELGITIFPIDIERTEIPLDNLMLDIVIINQVLEHTKEIFFIFSEISRVLKPGGHVIVGVPNLASLHNRLLLLFGQQPTNIEVLGPHVRGFTIGSLKEFIESDGFFKVIDIKGSNFYGLPLPLSKYLSNLFPGSSASLFFLAERTEKRGQFIEVLKTRHFETNYFEGLKERELTLQ